MFVRVIFSCVAAQHTFLQTVVVFQAMIRHVFLLRCPQRLQSDGCKRLKHIGSKKSVSASSEIAIVQSCYNRNIFFAYRSMYYLLAICADSFCVFSCNDCLCVV